MGDANPKARKLPRLRQGLEKQLQSRWTLLWVAILAFLDSTVLLYAVEPLAIPVMLARKSKAPLVAGAMLAGCFVGSVAIYFAAGALYEPFIVPFLERFDLMERFTHIGTRLADQGFWALVIIGFTPVPYQLATVSAGIAQFPFPLFVLGVLIGRSIRYFGLALMLMWLGKRAETFLDRYQFEIVLAFVALFLGLTAWAYWWG